MVISQDKVIWNGLAVTLRGTAPGFVSITRCLRLLIQLLGLVTVPMTSLPPQHTVASLTVVLPPLNSFQQGSFGTSPRTFSERSRLWMESHPY
ncbi:hypothetical protein QOZ95_005470 [Paenibacillus brasilensis]|uniref:Uncharacterized protein n=1 Tax=Paenibacillus brasilensis TaxID=128574 RepID=A0ABU0L7H1_9BACL|nr:hypothetical protein [Paenibacillus brasilensis]